MDMKFKRNFCIVAHIDHGKSTLSDRLIQKSNIIDERKMKNQILTIWTLSANAALP